MSQVVTALWQYSGVNVTEAERWVELVEHVSEERGESPQDALDWALAWRVANVPLERVEDWCSLPHQLAGLPIMAAVAHGLQVSPWLLRAWTRVGLDLALGQVPVIAHLRDHGWHEAAVEFLATALGPSDRPDGALLARMLEVNPVVVLNGARAGLGLTAALELAEYDARGGSTNALLEDLVSARHLTAEAGARINVAITACGSDLPCGIWRTPAAPDARLVASARASLPTELRDSFLGPVIVEPEPVQLVEPADDNPNAWTRDSDEWHQIACPEDLALQPLMSWTDGHRIDALRRYLAAHLSSLGPRDYVEMSWPPEGYLFSSGSWGEAEFEECGDHGTDWDKDCEACSEYRVAWESDDAVMIYEPATWHWTVEVITHVHDEDSDSLEADSWRVASTEMDPRSVHFG